MHADSLPVGDRDEAPEVPAVDALSGQSLHGRVAQTVDAALRGRLRDHFNAFADDARPSVDKVARRMGISSSALSQYLAAERREDGFITALGACKYPSKVDRLEARVRRFLDGVERDAEFGVELVRSGLFTQVNGALCEIRDEGKIGLIHSPAGLGKSSGCTRWVGEPENELSALARVDKWSPDIWSLERKLCRAWPLLMRGYKKGEGRPYEFLRTKLARSPRVLVIDNAHYLHRDALQSLFDLHDGTGMGIALVGNPEVMRKITDLDQRFSRLAFVEGLTYADIKAPERLVKHLVEQIAPDGGAGLADYALTLASRQGHFRLVQIVLKGAARVRRGSPGVSWLDAAKAALARLPVATDWE